MEKNVKTKAVTDFFGGPEGLGKSLFSLGGAALGGWMAHNKFQGEHGYGAKMALGIVSGFVIGSIAWSLFSDVLISIFPQLGPVTP